eukprot:363278-Chlamydomonas_euryale.AAC.3
MPSLPPPWLPLAATLPNSLITEATKDGGTLLMKHSSSQTSGCSQVATAAASISVGLNENDAVGAF